MSDETDNPYRVSQATGNFEPSVRNPIGHNPAIVMFWMAGFGILLSMACVGLAVIIWIDESFLAGLALLVSSILLLVFWIVFIGTAKDLRGDFERHHERAKLSFTIAATMTFPLLPAIFVIWQINRRSRQLDN